jgi:integrase
MARDKGSGSIYQRKSDKRWFAQLTVDGRTKTKSSMDHAVVKRWLKETLKESHQGRFTAGKSPIVREYLTDWMEGRDVSPRTRVSYETSAKRVVPYIGHIRLEKVTENQIRAMWIALRDGKGPNGEPRQPLALTSLRTTHTHLNTAFKDAVKSRSFALTVNPVSDAKPGRAVHQEIHPLTEEEVQQLFATTANDPEYPIWVTLITTGLRVGELVGLKMEDVSLERAAINVRRSAYRLTGQGIVEGDTKTKKGRLVDLPPTTVRVLQDYLASQKLRKMTNRILWQEQGYVFTTDIGGPLDPNFLNKKFHLAVDKAGIERKKLHDTRHTYATLLFAKGEHPKVVQEQMGHSSIKITLDIYSAYIPTMGRSAADRMETLFA